MPKIKTRKVKNVEQLVNELKKDKLCLYEFKTEDERKKAIDVGLKNKDDDIYLKVLLIADKYLEHTNEYEDILNIKTTISKDVLLDYYYCIVLYNKYIGSNIALDTQLIYYLEKSIECGIEEAKLYLGKCYYYGYGVCKDIDKCIKIVTELALKKHIEAIMFLASIYYEDLKKYDEAVKYYKIASKLGNAEASYQIAYCAHNELGFKDNNDTRKLAMKYYKLARKSVFESYVGMGRLYMVVIDNRIEEKKAYQCFLKASKLNVPEGYTFLGDCYKKGIGVKKNIKKSTKCYEKGVNLGSVRAHVELGDCYRKGIGVEKQYFKAAEYYKMAVNYNYGPGFWKLGSCYLSGSGVIQDKKEAIRLFNEGIKLNDGNCMNEIGYHYYLVNDDYANAFKYFKSGASYGSNNAKINVGICYLYGSGVSKNEELGLNYLFNAITVDDGTADYIIGKYLVYKEGATNKEKESGAFHLLYAAEKSYTKAYSEVAKCYKEGIGLIKDIEKANFYLEKGIEKNDNNAKIEKAINLYYGYGCEKDYNEAFKIAKNYERVDNPTLKYILGVLYICGYGKKSDIDKGVSLLWEAIDAGYVDAEAYIGYYYAIGRKDLKNGMKYLISAANKGSLDANYWLYQIYYDKQDPRTMFKYLVRVAELGDVEFQYEAGIRYLYGKYGADLDYKKGIKWLNIAANKGSFKAQYELSYAYYKGYGVDKNMYTCLKWLKMSADNGYSKAKILMEDLSKNGYISINAFTGSVNWSREAEKIINYKM